MRFYQWEITGKFTMKIVALHMKSCKTEKEVENKCTKPNQQSNPETPVQSESTHVIQYLPTTSAIYGTITVHQK